MAGVTQPGTARHAVEFVTDALATFRLTRLVVDDEITQPLRDRVFARHDPDEGSRVGYLISCPFCSAVWLAAGVVAARAVAPRSWRRVSEALALAALAGEVAARV